MKEIIHPLTNHEISAFASQMSMMISAGITIEEALRLLEQDSETIEGKALIHDIYGYLDEGSALSVCMEKTGYFPQYVIDMTHIGEETGKLDEIFLSIAEYYDREEEIAEAIRQAVSYPLVMIVMMLCVIAVLFAKVLPIFSEVYEELGASMTGASAAIMNVGNAVGRYSFIFVVFILALVIIYFIITKTRSGQKLFQNMASSCPVTAGLYEKIAAGRFASGMALAIAAGFTPIEGVAMVEKLLTNKRYLKKVLRLKVLLESGDNFADATVGADIFSGTYGRMVAIGYKSGMLDAVMKKVSARYEAEVDREVSRFISILEPTLVAILSIIVGMILLSVMLPLMGIMSQIG